MCLNAQNDKMEAIKKIFLKFLNKWFHSWFDKALLNEAEGLTTNGIQNLPFALSKDLVRASLTMDNPWT